MFIYTWSSLFLGLMYLKSHGVWITNGCSGKYRVRFLQASGHSISINPSIRNLVLCVFLFKVILLIYTVDSFALNSRSTALWLTPDQSMSNTHVFSIRHITAFLRSGTLDNTSALHTGAILNNEKQKNVKNIARNRPWKGYLFTAWAETRSRAQACSTSTGNTHVRSVSCPWKTVKVPQALTLG